MQRAVSANVDATSTKSRKAREVPLPDQAAGALDRLSQRGDYLRHTHGSLLVAGGIDLASVKAAMGHARLSTTERYLHARSATDLADKFTQALGGLSPDDAQQQQPHQASD